MDGRFQPNLIRDALLHYRSSMSALHGLDADPRDAQASAYEVCTYLTLARFTDSTGCCSTAGLSAVNRYTGANKTRQGPVARAIERLQTIRAAAKVGKKRGVDLGPIVYSIDYWQTVSDLPLPDGPMERAAVRFVLPDFGEPRAASVVW